MKKLVVLALTVVGFISPAMAQDDDREVFGFGAKAGINISNIYDSEDEDIEADPKVGFVGGGFLSIPIGRYLGVQPEVLFSQKGFSASSTVLGTTFTFKRTTNHLDIPILLQFKPLPYTTFLFGPQYSYVLSRTDNFDGGGISVEDQEEFENDNIRKNIFGLVAGLDLNINRFVLGGRLAWDLQNNNGDGTSDTPRYKYVYGQITAGFRF
jgi:Outer membrane protein beta-barrel domain